LLEAFDGFEISGDVLELTCGPGYWTKRLVAQARSLTAVDASPEMIARAKTAVGDSPVRFVESDLFQWQPDRRYDTVFFGFWLSHVPEDRFDGFWQLIADSLNPGGRVHFVDDNFRSDEELIEGPSSPVVERRLNGGTAYRAVKVPYVAHELEQRLEGLGWDIDVGHSGPFYWGSGSRAG